ncbi:hypothetical protein CXG81DRAFT_25881 [Caulochytrium protostelioides]|uniref:Uncharacterized protein n=1 Tax=Caulochytrium protostelioides TaxID=1555241 RepID=A0A4P9X8Q0_9FUNG|nr:hypothetical protein CXG81DRAFT_25881 [Caulochytrium protostelioides]|eukprot:RKP01440.1 hypothetical protein CXG81DRAFT_25881 [Caulochytrium protostelioides]
MPPPPLVPQVIAAAPLPPSLSSATAATAPPIQAVAVNALGTYALVAGGRFAASVVPRASGGSGGVTLVNLATAVAVQTFSGSGAALAAASPAAAAATASSSSTPHALALAADDACFAAIDRGRYLQLWDVRRPDAPARRWPHGHGLGDGHARVGPGGAPTMATATTTTTTTVMTTAMTTAGGANAVAMAGPPSVGPLIVSGGADGAVLLWDPRSAGEAPVQRLPSAPDAVTSLAVPTTAAGAAGIIVAGALDGIVRTYDLRMGCLHADAVGAPVTGVGYGYGDACPSPGAAAEPRTPSILASTIASPSAPAPAHPAAAAAAVAPRQAVVVQLNVATGASEAQYAGHAHSTYRLASPLFLDAAPAAASAAAPWVVAPCERGHLVAWTAGDPSAVWRFRAAGSAAAGRYGLVTDWPRAWAQGGPAPVVSLARLPGGGCLTGASDGTLIAWRFRAAS